MEVYDFLVIVKLIWWSDVDGFVDNFDLEYFLFIRMNGEIVKWFFVLFFWCRIFYCVGNLFINVIIFVNG